MIPTFKNRSLAVNVTVKQNGTAKDLSSATAAAYLRSPSGTVTTLSPTITDATGGVVQVSVSANVINAAGEWVEELVITIGTDVQTVWQEKILAHDSIVP